MWGAREISLCQKMIQCKRGRGGGGLVFPPAVKVPLGAHRPQVEEEQELPMNLVRGTQRTWRDGDDGPLLSELCLKHPTPPTPPRQESVGSSNSVSVQSRSSKQSSAPRDSKLNLPLKINYMTILLLLP